MTKPETLRALADRVMQLEGPCPETDRLVALAFGYKTAPDGYGEGDDWWEPSGKIIKLYARGFGARPPRFTASLDAAKSLVQEGWVFSVARYWLEGENKPPFYADCADLKKLEAGDDADIFETYANTPENALTAVALLAQAAMMEAGDA